GDTSWDLQKQQQEDPDIKTAMGWVVNDNRPANKELASGSYCLKSLWNQFDSLAIDDGILVRRWINNDTKEIVKQAIVPSKCRRDVLKCAHNIKASGHLGIRKTLAKIKRKFYWSGIRNDVQRLEVAHEMVRQNTCASIQRQKQIHDRNISYETFFVGDQVYVYFPVKKVGTSSKFTSFWKGPYTVLRKMSVVLYEINCGRKGKGQVIHCDRIRKSKSQALDRENDNVEEHNEVKDDQMVESDNIDDEHDVDLNTDDSFD
ncbi:hypothetical protein MAR_032028, partial [Mya arenaria]